MFLHQRCPECKVKEPDTAYHLRTAHPDVAYVEYTDCKAFVVRKSPDGSFRCPRCDYKTGERSAFFVHVSSSLCIPDHDDAPSTSTRIAVSPPPSPRLSPPPTRLFEANQRALADAGSSPSPEIVDLTEEEESGQRGSRLAPMRKRTRATTPVQSREEVEIRFSGTNPPFKTRRFSTISSFTDSMP